MMSPSQFIQLKRMLQNNLHEVTCPCGERFYSSANSRAVYHNSACRQYHFRMKKLNVIENAEVSDETGTNQLQEQIQEYESEILNQLLEKNKQYSNKLKAI